MNKIYYIEIPGYCHCFDLNKLTCIERAKKFLILYFEDGREFQIGFPDEDSASYCICQIYEFWKK
jgi:hypothetical protein